MSDTYFDLPSRMEDSFPEIDSDIATDLRENNEEYAEIHRQISVLKRQFPCIAQVMDCQDELHLTALRFQIICAYRGSWRIWSVCSSTSGAIRMRWPISRKSKRFDTSGSEQSGPLLIR